MLAIFSTVGSHAHRLRTQLALAAILLVHASGWAAEPAELTRLKKQVLQLWDQSRWTDAMPLAERLAAETIAQFGENNTNAADALHYWAYMVQENGDYDKAEQIWLRALAIDERLFGKDTVETTRRLHMLASLYRDRGDHRKSAPLLQKVLAIRERDYGPDHPETAQILRSLGAFYLDTGDLAQAEQKLLRALAVYEQGGKYHRLNAARTLAQLGWLYTNLGDFDKVEEMRSRAFHLRKALHGLEHPGTAQSLHELALTHRAQGKFEQAHKMFLESLAIRERLLGTNHVSLSSILDALAENYLASGDFVKAESVLRRAQAVVEKSLGTEHPRIAGILTTLSRVWERQGDYSQAKKLEEQAYELREKAFGTAHPSSLRSLRQLAFLDMARGEPERAVAMAKRLQDGEEALLENLLSFTSERQRLASQHNASVFRQRYDLWADIGAVQPLARAVLRTKGLVLDSLLEDRLLAEASNDPQIREIINEGLKARKRLAQFTPISVRDAASTNGDREGKELSRKIEEMEASLARYVTGLGNARRALSVTVEQVQSALSEKTVLLEILRYRHYDGRGQWQQHYGALLLSRQAEPVWIRLGPADAIEKAIKLHQHAVRIAGAGDMLVQSLRELHERIWLPIAAKLPASAREIIISPDAELNFVSFAALPDSSNQFLGEEYLFSYVSSGRDLLVEEEGRVGTSELLIWANPDFAAPAQALAAVDEAAAHSIARELCSLTFRVLPGSEREGKALRDGAQRLGFKRAILHLGTDATEKELRRVHSPKVLHLATHGFVLPQMEDPLTGEEMEFASANHMTFPKPNAMLRSGLALAGAQHSLRALARGQQIPPQHDGIVTADEISSLDLRGTSLVVLSACDTGAGEALAGEGVLGLRRGFVRAGARNLLLTLWPIDDAGAAALVSDFYAEGSKTGNSPRALAQVQRTWLKKLRRERGIAEACQIAGPFILSFQGKAE